MHDLKKKKTSAKEHHTALHGREYLKSNIKKLKNRRNRRKTGHISGSVVYGSFYST
jgi:hypothetical protein